MRVVRIYHAGRDAAHRERDRAVVRAGAELTLVVPTEWPGASEAAPEPFELVELPVVRSGDVNRHRYVDPAEITKLVADLRPDVVDLHAEPFSSVVHQLLGRLPTRLPVVAYAAQNIDKRFPPPFAQWERRALRRLQGIYPCTRQAASVVVGKGFRGPVRVLPLAPAASVTVGDQEAPTDEIRMLLAGRMVPEKGAQDAVRVLAELRASANVSLLIVGAGPELVAARELAADLGVSDALQVLPWLGSKALAERYRQAHVVLAPSRTTRTWVEQFGRMVVEAQAAGAVVAGYASGALPEVAGAAGLLVGEGDTAALARAILSLRDRPARWQELRAAGLAVAAGCTWDAVAAGQLELYTEATLTASGPARVRLQRATAVARYGRPAAVAGGGRPFALPVLRENSSVARALARMVDAPRPVEAAARSKRLRVVYIDHIAQLSGGELALARLIAAVPGVDAHVILGAEGPLRGVLERAGATVEVLILQAQSRDLRRTQVAVGMAGLQGAALAVPHTFRLARRLRALRPDLVHTNSLKAGYYGSVAARLAGLPVIWHLRDRIATDYLPRRAVVVTRLALRFLPDLVLCNSEATLLTSRISPVNAAVIGSSVASHELETRAGRNSPVVGIVGRLTPWKGQDVFLRAFAAAFRELPDVRGRIIGSARFNEGRYETQLRALARELGLQDRVIFVGFSDQVQQELAGLDVLVHASTTPEPFGQVVLEGMAAGVAVVAAAAGGPLEIITPGVDGLLVRPGDVAELASALSRLVADAELRERLGRAGIERARDFSPERIGADVRALYDAFLARRRP